MTSAFAVKAAVALAAAVLPLAAVAAPTTPSTAPMRSMTFQVEFSSRTEDRVQVSGLGTTNAISGSAMGAPGGSSWRTQVTNGPISRGTITIDVIALTTDGLVVDITENAEQRAAPKTRVGISTKGLLVYDTAKAIVNEEELLLLQLLNRALVEGHDNDGVTWTDDLSVRGFKDVTTYRIVSSSDVKPGPVLHMELDRSVASSAARPFEATMSGKLDYNEQRAVPLAVSLRERRTTATPTGQQQLVDATYTYKLLADSLAKT
jgi:hypothetical protein